MAMLDDGRGCSGGAGAGGGGAAGQLCYKPIYDDTYARDIS